MLILLDIDGVLVTASSWKKPELLNDGFSVFNNRATAAFKKIVSETKATVLLTTSHKAHYSLNEWVSIFSNRGINLNKIDSLPENLSHLSRKDEIINWFNNSNVNEEFVIIDDDKSLNDLSKTLKEKLVLTNPLVGLTEELASKAISILNKKEAYITL